MPYLSTAAYLADQPRRHPHHHDTTISPTVLYAPENGLSKDQDGIGIIISI